MLEETQITPTPVPTPTVTEENGEVMVTVPAGETPEPTVETAEAAKPLPTEVTADQQAAMNLFLALRDPKTAPDVIRQLAHISGLDIEKPKEAQTLRKSITQILSDELGEDNSLLTERLGPALEKILAQAVEEKLSPIKSDLEMRQQQEVATRIDTALDSINKSTGGFATKLDGAMSKLMEQIAPGPNTPPEQYINYIFKLAKSEFDEAEKVKAQDAKRMANKSAPNVPSGVNPERVRAGSKLPTIHEAVAAAFQGKTLE